MREDMAKVVIERPRYGHSDPSKKTALRLRHYDPDKEYDEYPKHIPASMRRGTKGFSDLLGPLRRYLRSNVGRPWNKVWSEMKQNLDCRKTTGQHIFDHVKWEVDLHVEVDEHGVAYYPEGRARRYGPINGLFVHPRTGLLCWQDARHCKRNEPEAARKLRRSVERIPISHNQSYVRINGVWYIGDYVAYDISQPDIPQVEIPGLRYHDGKRWMQLVSKRKCTQQELQKNGLRNVKAKG